MRRLLPFIFIFLLTGCTPNEQSFKSNVPATHRGSIVAPIVDDLKTTTGATKRSHVARERQGRSEEPLSEPQPEINLDVPFFPQAPDADWGMPWQEACEEAASTLAYYYASEKPLTKEKFKEEIQGLVEWENKNFGDYKHTNIAQTAEMIKGHFGFADFEIIADPTIDQLKQKLSEGHVIIAPFAGRQLGNPFYSNGGPLYHMMVIRGYDKTHFITNDVGTKRGENFIYPYSVIMPAMHEWHDENINLGAKKVIVLKPVPPASGTETEK